MAELVALRSAAGGRRVPRRGRHAHGPAPSPLRGRGMEYAESREYTSGDDARHIDWRVTARSGRTHTKVYQAERERLSLLVADTSQALYYGTRVRFKSVQAARAGAVAAWLAGREGDRVAALRGSLREPPVPPAGGQRGVLRVLDALVRWYAAPPDDDAGLQTGLDHARRLLRPGARVLVLADPASVAAVPDTQWAGLARHGEVLVLLLVDRLEMAPPQGLLAFRDGGQRFELDLASPAVRERWARVFEGAIREVLERLPGLGVRVEVLPADAASDAWLPALDRPQSQVA
nr:DUF58 domain-containing protein [Lysobacter sp. GX 14042]